MPVSRHRKDHKKKVNKYKSDAKLARTRLQEQMMKEYFEKVQASQQSQRQENSELVSNDDIDIDLDVDLNSPLDQSTPIVEDVTPIVEDVTDLQSNDVENK